MMSDSSTDITKKIIESSGDSIQSHLKTVKFAANISYLFTELPFLERYGAAKRAGFKAVESEFPYGLKPEEVAQARKEADIEHVMLTVYSLGVENPEFSKIKFGYASDPTRISDFFSALNRTITYAKALECKLIHITLGTPPQPWQVQHYLGFKCNMQSAIKILEEADMVGVIGPIRAPDYFLPTINKVTELINNLKSPRLQLLANFFQLQMTSGQLTYTINKNLPNIGHVQIAQAPNRHEPNTKGEINYKFVFERLLASGYDKWIGLEYIPAGKTYEGLKWMEEFGFKL